MRNPGDAMLVVYRLLLGIPLPIVLSFYCLPLGIPLAT